MTGLFILAEIDLSVASIGNSKRSVEISKFDYNPAIKIVFASLHLAELVATTKI